MNMEGGEMMCKCPHHKAKGWLMLIVGISLLLNALGKIEFNTVYIIFSISIIILSLGKMCRCCHGMCHKMCDKGVESK